MKNKIVVGISGAGNSFHDNSVALIKNGKIIFAASEERYTRIKHDSSFPKNSLKAAFKFAKVKNSDVSYFASGWPKLSILKFLLQIPAQDLLESTLGFVKRLNLLSLKCLLTSIFAQNIKDVENEILPTSKHIIIDHYIAHAASTYRTSGIDNCLAVVWDGFGTRSDGSLASGGVFVCEKGEIIQVETHSLNSSLGLFYEAITNALGFTPAEGEGKTMGLAAFGNPDRYY